MAHKCRQRAEVILCPSACATVRKSFELGTTDFLFASVGLIARQLVQMEVRSAAVYMAIVDP
jgi:hypothetical protein